MSRPDKSAEATLRILRAGRAEPPPQAESPEPVRAAPRRSSLARTMVYSSPEMKEKFREIAFHERCKENDLWLTAAREFLAKRGHK